MPWSLGTGGRRRYWPCPCRAAPARGGRKKGGPGRSGCLHFHVHLHPPVLCQQQQQVRPFFSPLSSLLILPVLCLAVLAFLVCFGWFTFVYFVSSMFLRKHDSPVSDCSDENGRDAGEERCRNEEQARNKEEEGVGDRVAGGTAGSGRASVPGTANDPVHLQSAQESVATTIRKEAPAGPAYVIKSETLELIDKRITRTVVVICSDYSSAAAESNVMSAEDLLPDARFSAKDLPEDFFGGEQDARTTSTGTDVRTNELREEDHFSEEEEQEKHVLGVSDGTDDLNYENEMSGSLLLDSGSESKCSTVATEHDASFDRTSSVGHENELTEDNYNRPEEASEDTSTSVACPFSDSANNQVTREEEIAVPSTENIIHEAASGEISMVARTEDEDQNSCVPEGESRRSAPLSRRSQPPWWNLCGVLEVFAGSND